MGNFLLGRAKHRHTSSWQSTPTEEKAVESYALFESRETITSHLMRHAANKCHRLMLEPMPTYISIYNCLHKPTPRKRPRPPLFWWPQLAACWHVLQLQPAAKGPAFLDIVAWRTAVMEHIVMARVSVHSFVCNQRRGDFAHAKEGHQLANLKKLVWLKKKPPPKKTKTDKHLGSPS